MSRQRKGSDPLGADRHPDLPARAAAPAPVGEALAGLRDARGWRRRLEGARVHEVWEQAVGPKVAARVRPVRLHGGVLVVEADSSAWATQVRYLAPELIAGLNAALGEGMVERVTVQTGSQESGRGPRRRR